MDRFKVLADNFRSFRIENARDSIEVEMIKGGRWMADEIERLHAEIERLRTRVGDLGEALKNERIINSYKTTEIARLRKIEDAAYAKLTGDVMHIGAFLYVLKSNPRPESE